MAGMGFRERVEKLSAFANPAHEIGGGEAGRVRQRLHDASDGVDRCQFIGGQVLDLEIPAFDIHIRLGLAEKVGGAFLAEDDDGVHGFQGAEDFGAVRFVVDGAAGTLEFAHGAVAVQSDQEDIALIAGGLEVGHMAGVEDVEATVGDDDGAAGAAHGLAPGRERVARQDLLTTVHGVIVCRGGVRVQWGKMVRLGCRGRDGRSVITDTCVLGRLAYTCAMKRDVVPVQIRGILPANSGCAIFIGNDDKVFVIQVESNMGLVIGKFLRQAASERPLTHDLIVNIFEGFNITVDRVVITELRNSTYFARLILHQQNELGRKIVEIDARPSDCIAIATAHKKPIFVAGPLFEQVDDMTELLERINENGGDAVA
jgi:uncharacterized protein